jgi:predicted Zn-dependent protease
MGMKYALILLTFSLLITGCSEKTVTAQSPLGSNFGSCVLGKWSSGSLPLAVKMSSEFSSDYTNVDLVNGLNPLEQMAKVWNDSTSPTVSLITTPFPIAASTGFANTSSFRDSEIGIYKSHTWFNGISSSALAITQFYGVVTAGLGGQYIDLTHADIIVNYRDYGSRLTMTNNPMIEFDLPTIVLHEMGHLMGLCHESSRPSIMAPYYLTTQRSLQNFDRDIMRDIYIDGVITPFTAKANNTNALTSRPGTEVQGIIELHADGKCVHYVNGKKVYEHIADSFKK